MPPSSLKTLKQKASKLPLPVTLLSGFLGSGKTTLLKHILSAQHGLRIAVVVNDIGSVNIDARLIRSHKLTRTKEKIVELQNGCICCTLRGDLMEELVKIAKQGLVDYIMIESSGISEPEQVAETFDPKLAVEMVGTEGLEPDFIQLLKDISGAGGLTTFARLDTTVTVIDAFSIFNDFHTQDLLSSRRDDVTAEDERTVSDLLVDQIEFADVIVLNKLDMVDELTKIVILDLLRSLNPNADVLQSSYGKVDVSKLVNTGRFDMDRAQTGAGWLQDLHTLSIREVNGKSKLAPKPETEEYNVLNFVYVRRRPFHPERLFEMIHDKFILQHPEADYEEVEDDAEDDIVMTEPGRKSRAAVGDNALQRRSVTDKDDSDWESGDGSDSSTVTPPTDSCCSDDEMTEAEDVNDKETGDDNCVLDNEEQPNFPIPDPKVILANKRADPLFNTLFCSKGAFWLATRPWQAGDWSQAGAMLTLQGGHEWFCQIPEEEWGGEEAAFTAAIRADFETPWGDRKQELVFIGAGIDREALAARLDQCLLNDAEMKRFELTMAMADPGDIANDSESDRDLDESMMGRPHHKGVFWSRERVSRRLAKIFNDGFPEWVEDEDDEVEEEGHEGHHHAKGVSHSRHANHRHK